MPNTVPNIYFLNFEHKYLRDNFIMLFNCHVEQWCVTHITHPNMTHSFLEETIIIMQIKTFREWRHPRSANIREHQTEAAIIGAANLLKMLRTFLTINSTCFRWISRSSVDEYRNCLTRYSIYMGPELGHHCDCRCPSA